MAKTLLIIGAGVEAYEGILIAKSMGLQLIIVDGDENAIGLSLADIALVISTYDGDEIAKQADQLCKAGTQINGVIAMCADVPLSVAKVATKLSLPGMSMESALWVADKLLMKQRLAAMNIPIPRFSQISKAEDLLSAEQLVGLPFIIKPVDSRGSRGVQIIESKAQFEQAFIQAQVESPTNRVMIEEYLTGPQISTETLIDNEKCYTSGFSDRNYEWLAQTKPNIIENGGDAPSSLNSQQQAEVIKVVEQAALALNINIGVAKGDMVLTSSGAKVIEIAGRLSGGYFSTIQIPLATGVNFIQQAIKLALGQHIKAADSLPKFQHGIAIRYLNLKPGKVISVKGAKQAQQSPGVKMFKLNIGKDDEIPPLHNHTQRAGFVIAEGKSKEEAINHANMALNEISVEYV